MLGILVVVAPMASGYPFGKMVIDCFADLEKHILTMNGNV